MKKVIRLTEGDLTKLIRRILKEDSQPNTCIKEYKSPFPGDPYTYRIGKECIWETKSDKSKKQTGNPIPDWISLYKNKKANDKLNTWFPNAKSDCSKCKEKSNKKGDGIGDCPKTINCQPSVNGRPKLCDSPNALQACKDKGTKVFL